jgi:hypothetical protein
MDTWVFRPAFGQGKRTCGTIGPIFTYQIEGRKMKLRISIVLSLSVFVLPLHFVAGSEANEPNYPPVIQCQTAGNKIQIAVNRLDNRYKLLIPVSRGCPFPLLNPESAKKAYKVAFKETRGDFIDQSYLAGNRVNLMSGDVVIGGVPKQLWKSTPLADGATSSYNEIQTTVSVPTSIIVGKLPRKVKATFFYYTISGERKEMGNSSVDGSGNVTLPPVTIGTVSGLITFQVTAGNVTRFVTLRATKN